MACLSAFAKYALLGYDSTFWAYFQARDLKCKKVNPAVFQCIKCKYEDLTRQMKFSKSLGSMI